MNPYPREIKPLGPEDLKSLDRTRQQLAAVQADIVSLQNSIFHSGLLPPWDSIQAQTIIISQRLRRAVDAATAASKLFSTTVVFPFTDYPGRTHENLLHSLIRKKHDPSVESWVQEGRDAQAEISASTANDTKELLEWASQWSHERIVSFIASEFEDVYTAAERQQGIETVRTGLKKSLEEDEDEQSDEEDEDEDDDDMQGVKLDITRTKKPNKVNSGISNVTDMPGLETKDLMLASMGFGVNF